MLLKIKLAVLFIAVLLITGLPLAFSLVWLGSVFLSDLSYIDFFTSSTSVAKYTSVFAFLIALIISIKIGAKSVVLYLKK